MWSHPIASSAVSLDVNAICVTADARRVPVLVSLGFDPLDPVAVTLRTPEGDPWLAMLAFAREMLLVDAVAVRAVPAGAGGPAGSLCPDVGADADADIDTFTDSNGAGVTGPGRPGGTDAGAPDGSEPAPPRLELIRRGGRRLLSVSVSRPGGWVTLELPVTRVHDFVLRTYELVPREAEATMIDLDLALGLAALGCE